MWVSFACLDTQHICCCRFRLGTLNLFNTEIGIDECFRDHGENFGFTP